MFGGRVRGGRVRCGVVSPTSTLVTATVGLVLIGLAVVGFGQRGSLLATEQSGAHLGSRDPGVHTNRVVSGSFGRIVVGGAHRGSLLKVGSSQEKTVVVSGGKYVGGCVLGRPLTLAGCVATNGASVGILAAGPRVRPRDTC